MTLDTYLYNVQSSWNKLLKAHAEAIQADLRNWVALPGTAKPYSTINLPYFAQKQPESFTSIRGWIYLEDVPNPPRRRLEDHVQVDIFVKNVSASTPDTRVLKFIQRTLLTKLDIRTGRNAFYGYFPVLDYASNPTTPRQIGRCRIESKTGFRDAPDTDPLIMRKMADFKLIHK